MNNEEYHSIIQILKSSKDATEKYDIPALMNYQFHLIARIMIQHKYKEEIHKNKTILISVSKQD